MSKFLDELCIDVNDYFDVDILKKTRKQEVVMARACFIVLALKIEHHIKIHQFLGVSRVNIIYWRDNYEYKLTDKHYYFIDKYNVEIIKNKAIKNRIKSLLNFKTTSDLEKIKQFIIDLDKKSLDI